MPNAIFSALKAVGQTIAGAVERAGAKMPTMAEEVYGAASRGAREADRLEGIGPSRISGKRLSKAPSDAVGAVRNDAASRLTISEGRVTGNRLEQAARDGVGPVRNDASSRLTISKGGVTGKRLEKAPRDAVGAVRNEAASRLTVSKGGVTGKKLDAAARDTFAADYNQRVGGTSSYDFGSVRNYIVSEGRGKAPRVFEDSATRRFARGAANKVTSAVNNATSFMGGITGGVRSFIGGAGEAAKHGFDVLGVSAASGAIGGIHGALTYNPDQERDPLLAQTPVIGRFKAAAQGAVKGAAIGAAGGIGAKTIQLGARAMLSPEAKHLASTETLTGAFARGFKGMNAPGDIPIGETAARGKRTAAEGGYFSFSKIHGKALDEAEDIIADGGTSAAANIANGARQKRLYQVSEEIGLDVNAGASNARGINYAGVQQFRKLNEFEQGLVGATELPGIVASAIGGVAGTVNHAGKALLSAYKKHIIDPSKQGKAVSAGIFHIQNPNYPSSIPGVKEKISRDATAPFVATIGTLGAAAFGIGGAIGATAYGAPAGHPMNAIFRTGDSAVSARAQMEADSAQKIKMQRPTMLGLNDTDEAYFTNPALKPKREARHTPGKYNDDGSLVFALSNLRRAV